MNLSIRKAVYTLILSFTTLAGAEAQNHPKLIANPTDKPILLEKIKTQPWADSIFHHMEKELYPYVMRYQMTIEYDPAWLLSRYQMNWVPGEFFTECFTNETGAEITQKSGNAPYPTIKYSTSGIPTDEAGYSYRLPEIEELMPYDTASMMRLQHPLTLEYTEVDAKSYTAKINQKINKIALKSAIMYWLTDQEEYGYLAADLLNQWAKGLYNQSAVTSENNSNGLLCLDALDDIAYKEMILTYDFIHDFLNEYSYETSYYQPIFERIAESVLNSGSTTDESSALESATFVMASLSLDDAAKRDKYMQFYLDKDSVNNKKGQLSLKTITKSWMAKEGYWKEPALYQNKVLPELLLSALIAEKNGYPVVRNYPMLTNTFREMMNNSFPNLMLPNFGDTRRASINPEILEFSVALADAKNNKAREEALNALAFLASRKLYQLNSSSFWPLLLNQPTLDTEQKRKVWNKMGEVDYAKNYFVRSGMDPEKDFMITMQGGSFLHNHADGLSMELYGRGCMLGIDPGTLEDLNHPLHVDYYSQWAAHNTVIPAGSASPDKLYKGGDASKNIGNMSLSGIGNTNRTGFISGKYTERFTKTNQERTVGYIKSSDSTGYYIDIFRSNNRLMNDYIYHNVGDSVELLDHNRKKLSLHQSAPFTVEPDFPGIRFFKNSQTTGKRAEGAISLFKLKDRHGKPLNMQAFFVSTAPKTYYIGETPRSLTVFEPYDSKPTPTVFVRQEGEAWTKPFAVVFEPYRPSEGYNVNKAEWDRDAEKNRLAALKVQLNNGQEQVIIQSPEPFNAFKHNGWTFSGYFGVIFKYQGKVTGLEMAKGKTIGIGDYLFTAKNANASFEIRFNENGFEVKTDQQLEVKYAPYRSKAKKKPALNKRALVMKRKSKDTFIIPAKSEGTVTLK
ncbi:MAG: heparinase II/III domain-containing protein [Bacteroidales bacterium]